MMSKARMGYAHSTAPIIDRSMVLLGVALLPLYFFDSGGIQPAHIILALLAFIVTLRHGLPASHWVIFLAAISSYSFILESFYLIAGGAVASLMNSVFFFYNFFLVTAIYSYCRNYGLSTLTPGVLAACAIALLTVGVAGVSLQEAGEGRVTGTFNNPNQLGYFSVCVLSLAYLLYSHGHLKYLTAVALFFAAIFLSIVSLSKAAMVANFVVAFLALRPVKKASFAANKVFSRDGLVWVFMALCGISAIVFFYIQGAFDDFLFSQRLANMAKEDDSSLAARGYFAFLEGNTVQFFFGLGSDVAIEIVGHEVHSTLGSVLNNYGFIGFFFFSGALVVWALKLWRAYGFVGMCCLAAPAMLYGITHNGIRFTAFWVLFGASMAMATRVIEGRKLGLAAGPPVRQVFET